MDASTENRKYRVILADPPWKFKTYSRKGLGRHAEAHYDCMTIQDIAAYPVSSYADQDCVLFLWVTDPFVMEARNVIESWGFIYKTIGFYWVKEQHKQLTRREKIARGLDPSKDILIFPYYPIGTGYWSRANPEICLLATKGHPKRKNADVEKLIRSPRTEHSKKPAEIYDRIERLCDGPYLELFARQKQLGWDALGDEVDTGIAKRRWKSSGPSE